MDLGEEEGVFREANVVASVVVFVAPDAFIVCRTDNRETTERGGWV
jgi:hypothetical protein